MRYLNPIRLIVYYPNAKANEILRIRTDTFIAHYYYFIITIQQLNILTLWTFDNRNDLKLCIEDQQLIFINQFSTFHLKWKLNPIIPKKHLDFYGCMMNIGIYDKTNFFKTYSRKNQLVINEFLLNFLTVISKRLNFRPFGKLCSEYDCSDHINQGTFIYNILDVSTIDSALIGHYENMKWMFVMMNIECT